MPEVSSLQTCASCGKPFSSLRARCPTCSYDHRHRHRHAPLAAQMATAKSAGPRGGRYHALAAYLAIGLLGLILLGAGKHMLLRLGTHQAPASRPASSERLLPSALGASLVALGLRSGSGLEWRAVGVFASSDGYLIADQAAWPTAGSEVIAAAALPGWQGELLCALFDGEAGVAVFHARSQEPAAALLMQPLVLSTIDKRALDALLIVHRPQLRGFRAIPLSTGAPPLGVSGPMLEAAGREVADIVGFLRASAKSGSRVLGANDLQELLVRARTASERPCGTLQVL